MPCRAPALLRQCRVHRESPRGSRKYSNCQSNSLTDRPFCSVLLLLFTVVGIDRCKEDWYASENNLRGTPRCSRKKPKPGRQPTGRPSTAVLCRGLEKNGMVRVWHGHGMASVNQKRPHCVNQMGKTHSKPLAARHGRGTAWARHAMCESGFRVLPFGFRCVSANLQNDVTHIHVCVVHSAGYYTKTTLLQVQITCCTNIFFSITTHFGHTLRCSQYRYTAMPFGAVLPSSGEPGKSLFALT